MQLENMENIKYPSIDEVIEILYVNGFNDVEVGCPKIWYSAFEVTDNFAILLNHSSIVFWHSLHRWHHMNDISPLNLMTKTKRICFYNALSPLSKCPTSYQQVARVSALEFLAV